MEINTSGSLLTQKDIDSLEEIKKNIEQGKDEWTDTGVETVKEVLNPYIDKVRNGMEEASKLVERIVAVIKDTDIVSSRKVRKEKSIDTSALSKELARANDLLGLCKQAYYCLEFVCLKVRDAICGGLCNVDQGRALLQSVIETGDMFDATVVQLGEADRVLTYYPTTAQRELDELTQDCLNLFTNFSNNDQLFSADNVVHDIEIFREYQDIIHQVEIRSINATPDEAKRLKKQVESARLTESEILNKLNACIDAQRDKIAELILKEDLSNEDINAVIAAINYIGTTAQYYREMLMSIHNQLTEYDDNEGIFVRKEQVINVQAMQTFLESADTVQTMATCMDIIREKLQAIKSTGEHDGIPNFDDCLNKSNLVANLCQCCHRDLISAQRVFAYSPFKTLRELDHFPIDTIRDFNGQEIKNSPLEELTAFSTLKEVFDDGIKETDKKLLRLFESLLLGAIAACQRMSVYGNDASNYQLTMARNAVGCVKVLHDKAVAKQSNDADFVGKCSGVSENIQESFDDLQSKISTAATKSSQQKESGFDANFIKECNEALENIQKSFDDLQSKISVAAIKCSQQKESNIYVDFVGKCSEVFEDIRKMFDGSWSNVKTTITQHAPQETSIGDANDVKQLFKTYRTLVDVSGLHNDCFFNAVNKQRGNRNADQYSVKKLREVAHIDVNEDGDEWQAYVDCAPAVATYLRRPIIILMDQVSEFGNGTGVQLSCPGDTKLQNGYNVQIHLNHLIENSTMFNVIIGDDGMHVDQYGDVIDAVAKTLNVNSDELQNMTIQDALGKLLNDENVIALYLDGSTTSGHYQSYVMPGQVQQQSDYQPVVVQDNGSTVNDLNLEQPYCQSVISQDEDAIEDEVNSQQPGDQTKAQDKGPVAHKRTWLQTLFPWCRSCKS